MFSEFDECENIFGSTPDTLPRREFLVRLGLLPVVLFSACGDTARTHSSAAPDISEEFYIDYPEREIPLNFKREQYNSKRDNSELDPNYLEQLVQILQRTNASREGRARNIISNLAWIIQDGAGTAFKIDASGYFITAAHLLRDKNDKPLNKYSLIYDPNTGVSTPIRNIIVPENPVDDLGVFYAPLGEPRRPLPGISFDFTQPLNGESLWMHSLGIQPPYASRFILHGEVDHSLPNQIAKIDGREIEITTMTKIRGMIPFGGSSGSPVIDTNGSIRGVESGVLLDGLENRRENYLGSTITLISGLNTVIADAKQGKILTLPTVCEGSNVSALIKC